MERTTQSSVQFPHKSPIVRLRSSTFSTLALPRQSELPADDAPRNPGHSALSPHQDARLNWFSVSVLHLTYPIPRWGHFGASVSLVTQFSIALLTLWEPLHPCWVECARRKRKTPVILLLCFKTEMNFIGLRGLISRPGTAVRDCKTISSRRCQI